MNLVILPNQLFEIKYFKNLNIKKIIVVEEPIYFGFRKNKLNFNKKKIILHRSSMKYYENYLINMKYNVEYYDYKNINYSKIFNDEVYMFKIYDYEVENKLKKYKIIFLDSPMFLMSDDKLNEYYKKHKNKNQRMNGFYNFVKTNLNILKNVKSQDKQNREKIPKDLKLPKIPKINNSKYVLDSIKYVNKHFKDNYGDTDNFIYPITHKDSKKWLKSFIQNKLKNYGKYQDSIKINEPFLFHSIISPMINIGLITPKQVIEEIKKYKDVVPLNSYEGFIRQLIGWREYQRYIYMFFYNDIKNKNVFNNKKKLSKKWYDGDTGILPVDDSIKMGFKYGYLHHILRLMVIGLYMTLSEIHPDEVYKWMMEFSIDSYDWVMFQNISMATYRDGGLTMSKPYLATGNYIIKMSDYKKGEWSEKWKALYYHFINKNKLIIKKTYYKSHLKYYKKEYSKNL